jgi:hypothetical protein
MKNMLDELLFADDELLFAKKEAPVDCRGFF